MKDEYSIEPMLNYYACIVDLLARAGRLDEAYEFIQVMPVKSNLYVRGALLGACRKHENVHLAEIAALKWAETEPESSGRVV